MWISPDPHKVKMLNIYWYIISVTIGIGDCKPAHIPVLTKIPLLVLEPPFPPLHR